MKKIFKKINPQFALLAVLVVLVGAAAGYLFSENRTSSMDSEYSAVYLVTGDIYFGKFSRFPTPNLEEVLYLRQGVADGDDPAQIGLAAFRDVAWIPAGDMRISPSQIVWVAPISIESPLVEVINNL